MAILTIERNTVRARLALTLTGARGAAAVVLLAALGAPAVAQDAPVDEYRVKAAFLYNFAKFVDWPGNAFKSAGEPFAICIVGQNPFGSTLQEMVQGKTVGDRGFAVRQLQPLQPAAGCQILFVSSSERRRTRALLDALKADSILTVGETEDFTSMGGIVAFRVEGSRIRIDIDADAAARAKLRVSSKLLSLAGNSKK